MTSAASPMRWMEVAWEQEGADVREIGGPKANQTIVGYFHAIGRPDITSDEIAWCAAAAFYCVQGAGISIEHVRPEDRLLAVSLRKVGTRIDGPRVGAICIRTREGGHHVGFVKSWTARTIDLTGGNQSNAFNTSTFKRQENEEFYWPILPNVADASRIAKAALRQQKDAAKGSAPQVLPQPPAPEAAITVPANTPAPDVPALDGLPPFPPLEQIPGKLGAGQQALEAAISFGQFVGHKWPLIMLAVSAYFFARMAYDAWRIRGWRLADALTGKTVGGGA